MARTRAQALPRRSPRIKRNQERQQQAQNGEFSKARLFLTFLGPRVARARRIGTAPAAHPRPSPAIVGDLARRTQISRDFYQNLLDRHTPAR